MADEDKIEARETDLPTATSTKRKAEWFDVDDSKNSYVYVSGLPLSMTEEEFIDLMKRYGIIAKKTSSGQPFNIKLYRDSEGNFKGDAICCFARVESVELAITHLDGYLYDQDNKLHCERAKFQMKGSYDPSKKPRTLDTKSKQRQKKTVDKLLSWEPQEKHIAPQKKVILKNMFAPEEIAADATFILELKQDVEDRCSEIIGEPKKVDIFDKHPEGVIAVTFTEASQAEACVKALDNEFYNKRVVKAELWDGKTKYRVKETEEETQKRLEKWHADIQKSDDEEDAG